MNGRRRPRLRPPDDWPYPDSDRVRWFPPTPTDRGAGRRIAAAARRYHDGPGADFIALCRRIGRTADGEEFMRRVQAL